jgi:hypothetical protein
MSRTSDRHYRQARDRAERVKAINKLAHQRAMEFYVTERRDLLLQAGLTEHKPTTRERRRRATERQNEGFRAWILERLADGQLDYLDDEDYDLVKKFLENPTRRNRINLHLALVDHDVADQDRAAFMKFA